MCLVVWWAFLSIVQSVEVLKSISQWSTVGGVRWHYTRALTSSLPFTLSILS